MTPHTIETAEDRAFQKLGESSLFQTYRTAFRLATGLDVELRPAGEEDDPDTSPGNLNGNSFCSAMNAGKGCEACVLARKCLFESASHQAKTIKCFAGLKETAIPIRSGNNLIAFLRTGQIFHSEPDSEDFEAISAKLQEEGIKPTQELEARYLDSPVLES
ncbi:MAG: PocR ligand-binding domain-containing protein, partial [Verrucomicrobiota bacterium]